MKPVSVIIPHRKTRAWFLERMCLPSVRANDPAEIIVIDEPGDANTKRNKGAKKATQPYLLFVDDDNVLMADCLEKMLYELESRPIASFAYCNTIGFHLPGIPIIHGRKATYIHKAGNFSQPRLQQEGYINMTSLIRAKDFIPFDPQIQRFQDWDFYLTMVESGKVGIWIDDALLWEFHIDRGISAQMDARSAAAAVRAKHQIGVPA